MILDAVDSATAAREVQGLLAQLRAGHVLITSRIANWRAGVEPLELRVLASVDGVAFLLERTPHRPKIPTTTPERTRSRAAGRPGPGPGAGRGLHRQTVAKLRRVSQTLAQGSGEVLKWHDEQVMGYPASVAVTWETTFAQLTEPEQRLLEVLAWLSPEPIPLLLIDAAPLAQAIPDPREALAGLAGYSLARFEERGETYGSPTGAGITEVALPRPTGPLHYKSPSKA